MSINPSKNQNVHPQTASDALSDTSSSPALTRGLREIETDGRSSHARPQQLNSTTSVETTEEAQSLLAAIVASSDDAIVSKTLDGIITSWNNAAATLFGYSAEEAVGRHITFIIPPELRAEEEEILAKLRQGIPIDHFETVRVSKDGRRLDVSLSISPVKDRQGRIIGAAKIARDITQRKALERKLQEQTVLFRQLFESNLIGTFVSDFAGTFLDANDAFLDLLGYTRDELLAGSIRRDDLTPPELHFLSQKAVKALWATGASDTYEKEYLHKSGRRIPVLVAVKRIEQTETCIGFVLDITERKRAEEQERFLSEVSRVLSSTLDYQETLANIARLVVPQLADWFSVDLVDANGHFELVLTEHQDQELVKLVRAYREKSFVDPDAPSGAAHVVRTGQAELYPEITDEMLVATIQTEEQLTLARQIGIRSAMNVPLVARGKVMGVVTFVSSKPGKKYDKHDLALAEEVGRRAGVALDHARLHREVRQGRDQLTIILEGVADGIVVYDHNGHIIYANEAAAKLTGSASTEDLLVQPANSVVNRYEMIDEQRQPFPHSQLTHQRVLAGEPEAEAIIGYTRKAVRGDERWSFVKSRPVRDEQGAVLYVISIVHDLTEWIQAEHRKDEFISMASHELKTPITSLKGFTYVLQRRLSKPGDEQSLHYLSRMDAQLDKLTKLVSDLLDISRIQTGKLELEEAPVDLDALVTEMVENMQAATSTHHLHILGESHARILADKDRLAQVLINVLANAIKYSPQADRVLVHLSRNEHHALVCIQDFGIGIDEAHQQKIFERFYQVTDPEEKTYPGLGIGLTICKKIIERHHGHIEVHSRKREGSTFSIKLPLLLEGSEYGEKSR